MVASLVLWPYLLLHRTHQCAERRGPHGAVRRLSDDHFRLTPFSHPAGVRAKSLPVLTPAGLLMQSGLLAGIQLVEAFTRSSIAFICLRNGSSLSSGSADGPSHFAWSGSGCASINRPAIPYRHTGAGHSLTCARRPPEAAPNGSRHCSAWVTSKMTERRVVGGFLPSRRSRAYPRPGCRNRS